MVNVGDTILLGGKTVKIVGRVAAGKHVKWTLDDGRTITDLDQRSDVQLVAPEVRPLPIEEGRIEEAWSVEDEDLLEDD